MNHRIRHALIRTLALAHEQHARRTALRLALDGVDIGPDIIHGHPVGHPVSRPVVHAAPLTAGVAS